MYGCALSSVKDMSQNYTLEKDTRMRLFAMEEHEYDHQRIKGNVQKAFKFTNNGNFLDEN